MHSSAEFPQLNTCPVCGGSRFTRATILWKELIAEWNLSTAEVDYIDLQQGLSCDGCTNNLRSMTLAAAMVSAFNRSSKLEDLCARDPVIRELSVIEMNPAGALTPILGLLPNHRLVEFPAFDMQRMDLEAGSVDVIVHSDTLEHVPNSHAALAECWRTLRTGGYLFYTVPVIIGRLTKTREGLAPSYHGVSGTQAEDFRVRTEYGADFWCEVFEAGFRRLTLTSLIFPASVALHATKV